MPCKLGYVDGKPSRFGFAALQHTQTDQIHDLDNDKAIVDYLILLHKFTVQHLEETESFPSNLTSRLRYCIIMDHDEKLLKEANITSDMDQRGKVIIVDRFRAIAVDIARKTANQECAICYTTLDQFSLRKITIKDGNVAEPESIFEPTAIKSLDDTFKIYAEDTIKKYIDDKKPQNFDFNHAFTLVFKEFQKNIKVDR